MRHIITGVVAVLLAAACSMFPSAADDRAFRDRLSQVKLPVANWLGPHLVKNLP